MKKYTEKEVVELFEEYKPTQEIIVEQQEERSPDEVRSRLAALLLKHPELKNVLKN